MTLLTDRKIRRPLAAFRWPLIILLVAALLGAMLGHPCSAPPYDMFVAVLTATVCITLWADHISMAPLAGIAKISRFVGVVVYDLVALVLVVVLASIPIVFFLPTYQCYGPRAKVSEIILATSPYRSAMSDRFEETHSLINLGAGLTVSPSGRVKKGLVTRDGTIVLASDDPPAVVFVTPEVVDRELKWKCTGIPRQIAPGSCRD